MAQRSLDDIIMFTPASRLAALLVQNWEDILYGLAYSGADQRSDAFAQAKRTAEQTYTMLGKHMFTEGTTAERIEAACLFLQAAGMTCQPAKTDGGFHGHLLAPSSKYLSILAEVRAFNEREAALDAAEEVSG